MVGPNVNGKAMPTETPSCLEIGKRVECNGYYGTLLYVGEVPPTQGTWLGIDWDDPSRGKHNGTHDGHTYFKTRHPTSGSFVRFGKVNFGQNCITAVHSRYGEIKDDETAGIDKYTMALVKKEMNAPLFEVVGFDKVNKKQSQFEMLEVVFLKEYFVNGAGPPGELRKLCPKIKELDLAKNLLNNWGTVAEITQQLGELRLLDVSENQLVLPFHPSSLRYAFSSLEHIVAGKMEYSWSDVLLCCDLYPNIQKLQVPFNSITSLDMPSPHMLTNLKALDLEGNPINDWKEINKLGYLQSLEILNVANVGLTEIQFPTDQPTEKTNLFPNLKQIYLSMNKIDEWESICELDKLKEFEDMSFRDNPVLQRENIETCRQLIIARIENLKKLNGVLITAQERKGAEYDYLKKYGQTWLDLDGAENQDKLMRAFTLAHPRYRSLIQKYGALEEGEVKVLPTTLNRRLINVEIFSPNVAGRVFKKKLPINMSVQKLLGLVQKLFNTGNQVPTLAYISSNNENIEVPLDNQLKEIGFYSIEDGDRIAVRWE